MKKTIRCGEVYYAHPYSSWERGSNENGMLRRFVPKGTGITTITAKQLRAIEIGSITIHAKHLFIAPPTAMG